MIQNPPKSAAYTPNIHHAVNAPMEIEAKGSDARKCATAMMYARSAYAGSAMGVAIDPKIIPPTAATHEKNIANGTTLMVKTFAGTDKIDSCPTP